MSERIEGVPVGCKLVRIGNAEHGDWHICGDGSHHIWTHTSSSLCCYPILAPDNVYNVVDLASVPIPEGYERDGKDPAPGVKEEDTWFRALKTGDVCTNQHNSEMAYTCSSVGTFGGDLRRIILRKIAPKTKRVLVVEIPLEGEETLLGLAISVGAQTVVSIGKGRRCYLQDVAHRIEERPL